MIRGAAFSAALAMLNCAGGVFVSGKVSRSMRFRMVGNKIRNCCDLILKTGVLSAQRNYMELAMSWKTDWKLLDLDTGHASV